MSPSTPPATTRCDAGVDPYALSPVAERPRPSNANSLSPAAGTGTTGYQVLAINDLGMHCGDLDTRVASILPPFQVLLSQVIQKGATPDHPRTQPGPGDLLGGIQPQRPDPQQAAGSDHRLPLHRADRQRRRLQDQLLERGLRGLRPLLPAGHPGRLFYHATDPAQDIDIGLPVPNVEDLYIGPDGKVDGTQTGSHDGFLAATQHAMPGIANPYVANDSQVAEEHYTNKPFFVNFPFGYVANGVNWFEGAGVPFAAFDDYGRENPYPMVRVQAKNSTGTVLATVDTVLPISGEASCKNCHGAPVDVPNSTNKGKANAKLTTAGIPVASSVDDPLVNTDVPVAVSVEYATDINVLRLHDLKHGAAYRDSGRQGRCLLRHERQQPERQRQLPGQ